MRRSRRVHQTNNIRQQALIVKPNRDPVTETASPGSLYIVATPIGNTDDLTLRAVAILREVDVVLCEDTRHTKKLLDRHGIGKPLESYHDFNEARKAASLVKRLRDGSTIALISDAGTPTISDPGYRLIRACRQKGIPVLPLPGPSAAIAALSISGLPTDEFHFVGFLPARKAARRRRIASLEGLACTLIVFEAPQRVRAALTDMLELLGDREVFLAREMTKLHEEHLFGRIGDVLPRIKERGEFTILVGGAPTGREEAALDVSGMTRQELLRLISARLGVGRNALYNSVVAWIGAEMGFALSQAVASGDTFEHRPSECGHCVQDFLTDLDLRDLPGKAAGFELGADDTLPTADLRFYPAALVVPCGHLPGHAAVAADLGNMAIPNRRIPRRLRADHCVLWRRYNHIQGLPIPFPQQIPCGRSIIGAVRQKTRERGIELIQEPG